ncbi:uncharacterized protein LOC121891812 [Scomber scombrus]|uniref:Uncharacterized protein LOC121891812 n=1 Tax=Scomber scombrus TaxID=13677 RepID=A0AAV1Q3P9_SCOSC
MGTGCSTNEPGYDNTYALGLYESALRRTCVLPDIGIDETMLTYSGLNSNAALQTYSDELAKTIPGYIEKVGAALGGLNAVPNAVGLGALVISMILEIYVKSTEGQTEDTYSMLRRVFGEEKASSVRDTMSEYLKRHQLYLNNDQRLRVEIRRLEPVLSLRITALKNSLLTDNQMSSRGFKIWVNGAAFRLQMMIHEARIDVKAGRDISNSVSTIGIATDQYLNELGTLLEKYKEYKKTSTQLEPSKELVCANDACGVAVTNCIIRNTEIPNCYVHHRHETQSTCTGCDMMKYYMDQVFSKYEPILHLRTYFSDLRSNIDSLANQDSDFTVPSAA